jgi:hypothetical protein
MHVMKDKLELQPPILYLTPSTASGANNAIYKKLLVDLGLDKITQLSATENADDKEMPTFSFRWHLESVPEGDAAAGAGGTAVGGDSDDASDVVGADGGLDDDEEDESVAASQATQDEKRAYRPFTVYLRKKHLLAAFNVGSGKYLSSGLLFNERAHTPRQEGLTKSGQEVRPVTVIKGRSDVVILSSDRFDADISSRDKQIYRTNVRFAVEIKPLGKSGDATLIEGESECVTQLIALNIDNAFTRPAVLLTNLVKTHYVFSLQDIEFAPYVQIQKTKCPTLNTALRIAGQIQPPIPGFSRGPSPQLM